MEGRILFSSPALSEFFKTSNFELNLKTGRVFTYLDPPEDIGIKCQKEPFDLEFLRDTLRGEQDTGVTCSNSPPLNPDTGPYLPV